MACGIRKSPIFDHYTAIRLQLTGTAPWLNDQLKIRSLKHGGKLTIKNRIRDPDAEKKDKERYLLALKHHRDGEPKPTPAREQIFKEEEITLLTLQTISLFTPNTDPRKKFSEASADLKILLRRLRRCLKDSENPDELIGLIRDRLSLVDLAMSQLSEAEQFFQPETLSAVVDWANRHDNSKREYSAGLNCLKISGAKQEITIQMLPTFELPSKKALQEIRASLVTLR